MDSPRTAHALTVGPFYRALLLSSRIISSIFNIAPGYFFPWDGRGYLSSKCLWALRGLSVGCLCAVLKLSWAVSRAFRGVSVGCP